MTERAPVIAARLREVFADSCREQQVKASLQGDPPTLQLTLEPQEGADVALLDKLFRQEMETAGVPLEQALAVGAMDDAQATRTEEAFRVAVARLRVLLIEYNSYLSGGLPWVFPTGADTVGARGLAKYRYPARAAVDIVPESDHMRIHFHRADLGEVTSSGFYIPSRIRGDFDARLRYRLEQWQPGDHSVCLALFAQDEPSQLRYYSQRRTAGTRPHEVMANFNNEVLTEPQPISGDVGAEGAFRITRRGDEVTSYHGDGDTWSVLGQHRGDPTRDVLFGSKIWSSWEAGPFEARLFDLTIEGELPDEQIPPVPERPDPRDEQPE